MIEARSLRVVHEGRRVLDDVSLRVGPGEMVGLIGPPEAGKSLLFKAMMQLVPLASGAMLKGGEPIAPEALREHTGMAFQNNALFDALTVYDNVAFPLRRRRVAESEIDERVLARLADVELSAAKDKLPNEISGGMKKRVGIARATIIDPLLGLFDDPVAGLDPITSARILTLIANETRRLRMCTVIVSNDLPLLLPTVQRVVMLSRGQVIYDGEPAQLTRAKHPEVVQFATGSDVGPL